MIETPLKDRYQLGSELGRGGMGVVYRAHDSLLDRSVAVKLVAASALGSEGRSRLLREAQATASLNHPHIVAVYDAGLADGDGGGQSSAFIVMELIDGKPLSQYVVGGLNDALEIGRQIASALESAHGRGIIHRDLKPENILISSLSIGDADPPEIHVKLMDFGLARMTGRTNLTQEGTLMGTLAYLAPEIIQGQPATTKSDLYSFGILLYQLVTGRLPFDGETPVAVLSQHLNATAAPPSTYNPSSPVELDALILDLMHKDPAKRPASASEVYKTLSSLLQSQPSAGGAHMDPLNRLVRGRLVGREKEFAEAHELWQLALSSQGQTLLISGEPGIGKTSLVRELSTLVELTGGKSLVGACYSETSAPYAPFAQIAQRALHGSNGDLKLPEFVLAEMMNIAPELQLDYPDVKSNPPLDPQAGQQRLFDSIVILCQLLSQQQPLLLVLEDAHWADDGTLALLRRLVRRGRQQSMMILATYREVELDHNLPFNKVLMELQREGLAKRIKLTRLDRLATERLLNQLFSEEITPDFLEAIYTETEGNPFFIEEVCKALIESGELYFRDGNWQRPAMDRLAIPQSIRVAIQSRVEVLDTNLQEVLRLAAILGREFDFDTLELAGSWDEDFLIDALEQAERAQLIEELSSERGGTFAFVHALIPSTLVESLSGLRRRRMHRKAASVIEELRPGDWITLAYHYSQANVREKAQFYLMGSGDEAASHYAHDDAIRYYGQALDYISTEEERFELMKKRAAVFHLAADREKEWADIQEMLKIASMLDDDNKRIDALLAQADYHLETEHTRTNEPAHEAAKLARSLGDTIREARALYLSGQAGFFSGDYDSSRSDLETAAERFLKAGLAGEAAGSLHALALTLVSLGLTEKAIEIGLRALEISRKAGEKVHEASSLRRLAIAYHTEMRNEKALPYAEQALELHRQLGDRAEEANALNVLGIIFSFLHDPQRAARCFQESIALAEEIESSVGIQYAIFNSALYTAYDNQYEKALNLLTEQVEKYADHPDSWLVGMLHSVHAIFYHLLGLNDEAVESSEQATVLLEGMLSPGTEAGNLTFRSVFYAEAGQLEKARRCVEKAAEIASHANLGDSLDFYYTWLAKMHLVLNEELHTGLDAANEALAFSRKFSDYFTFIHSLNLKARFHLALGQQEQARRAIEELRPLMDIVYCNHRRQELLWTMYLERKTAGDERAAEELLQEAREYIDLIAGRIEDAGIRQSWLEKVPDNPKIIAEAEELGVRYPQQPREPASR